jgi:hypothetical protein
VRNTGLRIADDIQCQRPKTQKDTNYRPLGFSSGKKKYTARFSDIVRTPSVRLTKERLQLQWFRCLLHGKESKKRQRHLERTCHGCWLSKKKRRYPSRICMKNSFASVTTAVRTSESSVRSIYQLHPRQRDSKTNKNHHKRPANAPVSMIPNSQTTKKGKKNLSA